ncbi:GNAT family N-acetyltransferase [Arthrobacter sp. NPDC097144]|uniref:GNAT family N-acetyltransferase n=1 Tax=Arthrobacter sp. NPDC097144 TaxID=3363946 RepID=UPI00381AEFE8
MLHRRIFRRDASGFFNYGVATVLGCSLDGDLFATAMVGHDGHRGWVYYLAVAPDRQESGLGRSMMEACEQWLIDRGAIKVQLMIRSDNSPVIGFYDQLGYELSDVQVRAKWLKADAHAHTGSAAL